jgi:hypothetical protein
VGATGATGATGAVGAAGAASRESIVEHAGELSDRHVEHAAALLASIPAEVRDATHDAAGAQAVVLALLLAGAPEVRQRQRELLHEGLDPAVAAELDRLAGAVERCGRESRLPIVDLALPALRQMSSRQYDAFRSTVHELIAADQKLSVFEFVLQRALLRHLAPSFARLSTPTVQYYSLGQRGRDVSVVLSTLARRGAGSEDDARAAFAAGAAAAVRWKTGLKHEQLTFLRREECRLADLDQALTQLALVSPPLKRALLVACEAAVAADRTVTVEEGELLRAIADAIDVPVPPLLPGQSTR